MLEHVHAFIRLLGLPLSAQGETQLRIDDEHFIDLAILPNGNLILNHSLANPGLLLATIEIEVYQRHFWVNVVEALLTFLQGRTSFLLPITTIVATALHSLPAGLYLQQEVVKERWVLPVAPRSAGATERTPTSTAFHSTGKTVTRSLDEK